MTEQKPVRYVLVFEAAPGGNGGVVVLLGYLVGQSLTAATQRWGYQEALANALGAQSLVRAWATRTEMKRPATGILVNHVVVDRLGLDELFERAVCAQYAHGRGSGDCRRLIEKLRAAVYNRSVVEQISDIDKELIPVWLDDAGMRSGVPATAL